MKTYGPMRGSILLASCALAAAWLAPRGAQACTRPQPEPDLTQGGPLDNATDVPTDVIPYYQFPIGTALDEDDVPSQFTLQTESSAEVALAPRKAHASGYELAPVEPLAANTTYLLTGRWAFGSRTVEKTIRFTTGSGPLQGASPEPSASIEHYQVTDGSISTCDPGPTGSCISFGDEAAMVEVAYIDALNQAGEAHVFVGSLMTDLTGLTVDTGHRCVRLRRRALNGTYSEPQTVCREDGALSELTSSEVRCTAAGLEGTRASSCSASAIGARVHRDGAWAACAGVLAWLAQLTRGRGARAR